MTRGAPKGDQALSGVSKPTRIVAALRELIVALDRRVPHVERANEIRIASDSAILRRQAVTRIEELTRTGSDGIVYDQELVDAIMSDDGWPARSAERRAAAVVRM